MAEIEAKLTDAVRDLNKQAEMSRRAANVILVSIVLLASMAASLFTLAPSQGIPLPLGNASGLESMTTIISVSVTRIGSVLIALFVIQILLSMFKYYVRLSNYYKGKAIALNLVESEEQVNDVLRSLSPENIDFSRTPTLPYEKVLELAKEAVTKKP